MYFNPSLPNNFLNTITKLDLAGNIIWSKGFKADLPKTVTVIDAPVFYNNTLIFSANGSEQPGGLPPKSFFTITKLNETDGSLLESNAYKTVMDSIGLNCNLINVNPGNSLSIIGNILVRADIFGNFGLTNIIFNTRIDENLNPINNFYYRNNIPLDAGDMYFDFNNQSQHAILSLNGNNPVDKYFVIFDKNDRVQRSRKFTSAATAAILYNTSVNLDNKQNLHFINHYLQAGKLVTEYARISNFAPNGTLGCFGKDTSILTQYPFTIAKQPFTWDNIQSDVLVSNDVPYTEDTAIVTKELVCKIVSYCDSVHIKGPAAACIGQPVRYTVSKNSGCFKNLDWQVDTSFVTIINTEGDSAITIRFTKAFTGYLRAAISDCVVRDSFFVTVLPSPLVKIINRDSLLCPGKKIVLKAKPGFKNYQWQDGSTADTLLVTTPGFYKVRGTDSCGLQSADSITVNNTDISFMLRATQTICRYDTAFIILPPDVSNITWLPAGNGLISNKTLLLYPLQTTTYQIRAERLADCPLTASSKVVIKNCEQVVFLPNAFTPNGDTRNDVFKASAFRPLQSFHLLIYNRYGQKIFETNNLATGWDGNFKGKPQPVGGYTYRCSYQFAGGQPQAEAGYFILIR